MAGTIRQLASVTWAQCRTFSTGVINTAAGTSSSAGGRSFPAVTAAFLGGAVTAAFLGASAASASSHADSCPPALGSCGKPVPLTAETLQPYTGTWLLVHRAPGSLDAFFRLFEVPGYLRWLAANIASYKIEVQPEQGTMTLNIASPIPFLQLIERYNLDGSPAMNPRRDFRPGHQLGTVQVSEGCLRIVSWWSGPFAGRAVDEFRVTSNNSVVLTSKAEKTHGHALEATSPGAAAEAAAGKFGSGAVEFRCLLRRKEPFWQTWFN